MEKTKLGISVGLLASIVFLGGLFGGYLVALVLTGYILLFEEGEWLKKSAVKAVLLMLTFSLVSMVINLIPNAINFVNYVFAVFGGSFSIGFLTRIVSVLISALGIIEKLMFIGLAIKASRRGEIKIPIVDGLVDMHM